MKQAFLLSEQGVINIYFFRDANPRVQILVDLGIPNFTVFSIELPIPEHDPTHTQILFREGVNVLLEQIKVFMAQSEFGNDGGVINTIAKCVAKTEIDFYSKEPMQGYEILFPLSNEFYHNVMHRLVKQKVAAKRSETVKAGDVWTGPTVGGRYQSPNEGKMLKELEEKKRLKKRDQQAVEDAKKIIDRYKQVVYKNVPGPMYVMLYDRYGKPRGVGRVTNQGVTKWAAGGWSESNWWIFDNGNILQLDKDELHAERAQRILKLGDIGMFAIYQEAFKHGWVRAALNGGILFMQAGEWDRKRLNLAQDFLMHQGKSGIRSITIENADGSKSANDLTYDEVMFARNPGELFRKFGSVVASGEFIDKTLLTMKSPGLTKLKEKMQPMPKYLVTTDEYLKYPERLHAWGFKSYVKALEEWVKSVNVPDYSELHSIVVFEVPDDAFLIDKNLAPSGLWNFTVSLKGLPKILFSGKPSEGTLDSLKTFITKTSGSAKTADEFARVPKNILKAIQGIKEIQLPPQRKTWNTRDERVNERLQLLSTMTGLNLKVIGYGSSRMVVQLTPKVVLKLAKNKAGIAQNEVEYAAYEKVEDCSLIARIFWYDPDFEWLICEKAIRGANDTDFGRYVQQVDSDGHLRPGTLDTFLQTADYFDEEEEVGWFDEEIRIKDQKAVDSLRYLVNTVGLESMDMKSKEQWGIVDRKGEQYPVLLDYGLTPKVFHSFYSSKQAGSAKAWWLLPNGKSVPVGDNQEHWEKAQEIMDEPPHDPVETLKQAFDKGWIRVSYYQGTAFLDAANWDKPSLRRAQDFAMSIGGVKDVVIEEDWRSGNKGTTTSLDTFLTVSNPGLLWRQRG